MKIPRGYGKGKQKCIACGGTLWQLAEADGDFIWFKCADKQCGVDGRAMQKKDFLGTLPEKNTPIVLWKG